MPPGSNFRILALDGGGSWALIQARALQAIYGDIPGHQVLADFDLAAGNSGGSIVLACLAENMKLSEIAGFFNDEAKRRSVFVDLPWYDKISRVLGLGPKYSTAAKLAGLRAALPTTGTMQVTELPAHVTRTAGRSPDFLITSFDYDRLRATYFRSRLDSRAASSPPPAYAPMLAEAVSASTNAPVNFFDAPVAFGTSRYWDGGIGGNNNPVLAAVTEALANNTQSPIKVLTLGTGSVRLPIGGDRGAQPPLSQPLESPGTVHDIKLLATSILDDPPDAASFISHVMLGQPLPSPGSPPVAGSVVRLSPMIQPILSGNAWTYPSGYDDHSFAALSNVEMDAVEDAEVKQIWDLCTAWIDGRVVNQAIRANRNFECEVGHRLFQDGADAWRREVGLPT